MAQPPLTLENIQPYIPEAAVQELQKDNLEELTRPEGANINFNGHKINVRIGWHIDDQTKKIDGIFLRIYDNTQIHAFVIKKASYNNIYIPNQDKHESSKVSFDQSFHLKTIQEIFEVCHGPRHDNPIPFQAEDFEYASNVIQPFFQNNQDMLPESLRRKIFEPEGAIIAPDNNWPELKINWTYVIGGILGCALIGYLAQRVFKHIRTPQSTQVK